MNDETELMPYAATAWDYRRAGWTGVLPLPVNAKSPVPRGFTGWAGSDPSGGDVQAWIDDGLGHGHAAGNIALRLPRGVYGLDVDAYGAKTGADALGRLIALCGPLPATWIVSSREDSTSGIRLFRADHGPDRVWRNEPGGHGAGIESIHYGHRYAVVWPSMHPDTGRKYKWRNPEGVEVEWGQVPGVDDLAELPASWIDALSEIGAVREGDMAGHRETVAVVTLWAVGEACTRTADARDRALAGLTRAISGDALHPSALGSLHELANLGNEGHRGVRQALAEHHDVFIEARRARSATAGGADTAGAEWWRMVRGAVGKLRSDQHRSECDCDLMAGDGLDFTVDARAMAIEQWLATSDPGEVEFVEPVVAGAGPPVVDDGSPLARMRREFVTARAMGQRPAPVPIVSGLLFQNTLAWMIGKSGSFKSFVALDIAAHVADDKPWAGRRVWGGPVVYVVAEGAGGMPLRVRAWESVNGEISDRLVMLPHAVQIIGQHWPTLIEACAEIRPVLVVIDTQARSTAGVNENDNSEMGTVIDALDRLRRATRACVMPVHHIGRAGEDARGASAIDGAQDTELKVARKGGPKDLRAVITTDKQKDAADTGEIEIAAQVIDLGADPLTGEPLTSLVTTPDLFSDPFPGAPWRNEQDMTTNAGLILAVLRELFSESGGTKAEVRAAVKERGLRGAKWINNSFGGAWDRLLQGDLVERVGTSQRFVAVNGRGDDGR